MSVLQWLGCRLNWAGPSRDDPSRNPGPFESSWGPATRTKGSQAPENGKLRRTDRPHPHRSRARSSHSSPEIAGNPCHRAWQENAMPLVCNQQAHKQTHSKQTNKQTNKHTNTQKQRNKETTKQPNKQGCEILVPVCCECLIVCS